MQPLTTQDLATKIQELQANRQRHAEAIAAIDQVLNRVKDALAANKAPSETATAGAPLSPTTTDAGGRPKRHRGKFARTAEESVLEFIRTQRQPSTAEINAHWRGEGRLGTANVTLLKLLKSSQIRRIEDPAVRGSRYALQEVAKKRPA